MRIKLEGAMGEDDMEEIEFSRYGREPRTSVGWAFAGALVVWMAAACLFVYCANLFS